MSDYGSGPVGRARRPDLTCGRIALTSALGFRVSAFSLHDGYKRSRHPHERPGLVLLADGSWKIGTRRCLDLRPGIAGVLPPGAAHTEATGAGRARVLLVEPAAGLELEGVEAMFQDVEARRAPDVEMLARLLWREVVEPAGPLSLEALAAELLLLLQHPDRERSGGDSHVTGPDEGGARPPWLKRALERIGEQPKEPTTLAELASEADVTPEHLARTFRRQTGCTVGDLLRRTRLLRATGALRRTSLSLSQVAHEAGFADQSHMTRVFRRYLGVTPLGYRRRVGGALRPSGCSSSAMNCEESWAKERWAMEDSASRLNAGLRRTTPEGDDLAVGKAPRGTPRTREGSCACR